MKIHLLFDREGPRIGQHDPPEAGPLLDSLEPLVQSLRSGRETLQRTAADDLLGLCDAAAAAWTRSDHPLAEMIRRLGLGFLPLWMRKNNLSALCARSLRGDYHCLDRFVQLAHDDPQWYRAQPRGLAVHWVAGNVPVVGLLSFLPSFLCKNANILKAPHESAGLLPRLLQGFADVCFTNSQGETITGRVLTDATAVLYFDRNDLEAARALSLGADVRVAWGGREAVEAVMNFPRRFGTEDLIFGPKLSLAIVGRERLGDVESARRDALAVARDTAAFDQQGCNSPHTVFVERGGAVMPTDFARFLAEALQSVTRQSPLQTVDPASAMNVLGVRAEYDIRGEAFYAPGMDYTVVYAEEDRGLAEPCYLRTLFVRPVDDVFDVVPFCSRDTQTAGLAVDERRRDLADALTAHGVERCPAVGGMRLYDAPWDGMFPMERLVRWVTTY
ncbi:MAG: hypothetical protein JXB10_06760 [Pirellulales bacterium]|nr:hypothetical protein [Pirellulales bacterium]